MKKYFVFLPLIISCNALHSSSVYKAKPRLELESENNNGGVSSFPSTSYSTNDLDNSSILCFRKGENNYQHCLKNLYETKRIENRNSNIRDLNTNDVLKYIKSHMPNVNALIEKLYNENQKSQKVRLEAANMLKPDDATYNQNVLKQKDLDMIKLFIKYSSCLNINKLS